MPDFGSLFDFVGEGVIPVLLVVLVLVLVVAYLGSRYKVAGANEALIISGRRERGPAGEQGLKVVRGQGVIVLPLVNKVGRLHLSARQINVQLSDAVTKQGIKVAVQGVATVKIGSDEESIRAAAERFLEREDQIDSIVKNVLEGSLRSIVGTLTVEELNYDRAKFQQEVQSAARGDLATSGLTIDNFTIQAIRDEVGYMDLIGQQETARRERDARMAKATADQEAAVREAEAQQVKLNASRDVSLRQAEVEALTAAANAKAAQSGPLAQAEATQEVVRKQTELAQLEADRTQKELIASTIRPAEADADAQVKRAEGEKLARIAAAQAEAERVRLSGEAQAKVVSMTADAEAHRVQVEGNAEAGIVFTKGEAEAKALALRAEAYRQFNEAAIIQTVLSMLPEIVRAAAEPMANIDNLTILSNDGASEMVKNTTRTVAEASATVKGLTGIDVPALLGGALGGATGGGGGGPRETGGGGGGTGGGTGGGGASRPRSPRSPAGGRGTPAPAPATGSAPEAAAGTGLATDVAAADTGPAASIDPTAAFARASEAIARAGRSSPEGAAASVPTAAASAASALAASSAPVAGPATAARMATPAAPPAVRPSLPAVGRLGRESTLDDAAAALAGDLRAVPGIERFGRMRLAELERTGPRPLRTMWRIAKDQLDERYGQLTIGEIMDRYTGAGGPPASA
ncbi:MAG: SPFH domain-containing protein [Chloroflexota bacterium]